MRIILLQYKTTVYETLRMNRYYDIIGYCYMLPFSSLNLFTDFHPEKDNINIER